MTSADNHKLYEFDWKKMNIPDFITPWLDRFYDPVEIDLLVLLNNSPMGKKDLVEKLNKKHPGKSSRFWEAFLESAWKRGVIKHEGDVSLGVQDFHVRYEYWSLFEGWKDIPEDIKSQLNRWEIDHYIASHSTTAASLKNGDNRDPARVIPEYVLLEEVKSLFKKISRFYLWPCNCRAMIRNCRQPEYTYIRFSNQRGIGWEISRSKALEIVTQANKQGLMQSAELGLDKQKKIIGALCNCCSDCCFPHLLSEQLDLAKVWPVSRYVARFLTDQCNRCGRCVKRCPFGIISQEKLTGKKQRELPVLAVEHCRGCGVCSTGCPQDAIEMEQIKTSVFEEMYK